MAEARSDERAPQAVVDGLVARGVPRRKAEAAVAENRVPLVLLEQLIDEPRPYTIRQVANASGLDLPDLQAIYAALGVGEDELHGQSDVDEAKQLRTALEVLPLDAVTRMARARRLSAAQLSVADMTTLRDVLLMPLREAGTADTEVADDLADSAADLWPGMNTMSQNAYRRAVLRLINLEVVAEAVREPRAGVDLAIGFVDVVGYTKFSAQVAADGLGETLEAFERHVLDVVGVDEQITVTKFIGDAAMIVGADVVDVTRAVVDIAEPTPVLDEIPVRGGVAAGEVVVRAGDYFGTPVNMAARLTDYARPSTVLADPALRESLEPHFSVRRIKKLKLQGLGSHRPLAVAPPADEDEG